jgi:hypothetical protein
MKSNPKIIETRDLKYPKLVLSILYEDKNTHARNHQELNSHITPVNHNEEGQRKITTRLQQQQRFSRGSIRMWSAGSWRSPTHRKKFYLNIIDEIQLLMLLIYVHISGAGVGTNKMLGKKMNIGSAKLTSLKYAYSDWQPLPTLPKKNIHPVAVIFVEGRVLLVFFFFCSW